MTSFEASIIGDEWSLSLDIIVIAVVCVSIFVLLFLCYFLRAPREYAAVDRVPIRLSRNATKLADVRASFRVDPIDDETALRRPFSLNESGYRMSRTASVRNVNSKYDDGDGDGI